MTASLTHVKQNRISLSDTADDQKVKLYYANYFVAGACCLPHNESCSSSLAVKVWHFL